MLLPRVSVALTEEYVKCFTKHTQAGSLVIIAPYPFPKPDRLILI